MKSIAEIVAYVNSMLPNNVATTDKYSYIAEIARDVRKYNLNYDTWDTNTSTASNIYALPSSHLTYRDIQWIGVSNTTYDAAISQSTCPFSDYTQYKYKGMDEQQESQRWIEMGSSQILLYGLSTADKYWIKAKYTPHLKFGLASSDSTTILNINEKIENYIQQKLAARICKSGAFPRIDLGNNYELEALELYNEIKQDYFDLERRKASLKIGYKDWW
jgi:hypothetical protein